MAPKLKRVKKSAETEFPIPEISENVDILATNDVVVAEVSTSEPIECSICFDTPSEIGTLKCVSKSIIQIIFPNFFGLLETCFLLYMYI